MNVQARKFGVGGNVRRVEDDALIRGRGRYTADVNAEGQLTAYFLRSDYSCAEIRAIDPGAAREAEGVHLVWTGSDVDGFMPIEARASVQDGAPFRESRYPLICHDRVRNVGDVVAMIVADTLEQAQEAADLIDIDFEPLPSVSEVVDAARSEAPLVWPEFGTNQAFESELGDKAAADAAFESAAKVVTLRVTHNRLVSNYMEPRAALAEWDPESRIFSLTVPSQGVHVMRKNIAQAMGLPEGRLRIKTYDVGGAFGPKYFAYRDYPLLALAAEALGRPVKWTATRMEHFTADAHGRDVVVDAELAIDDNGRIVGLRSVWMSNLGAYMSQYGSIVPWAGAMMSPGVYDIPATHVTVRGFYTNTTSTDAYRGAGRPEAALTIERIMDEGARACGLAPEEFRRRNFIRPEQMPYRTATGHHYDSGEFEAQMEAALEAADYRGFGGRLAESRAQGKLRGIGIATYIEACVLGGGAAPAHLSLQDDGGIVLRIGTLSSGQGHRTAYGQFVAEELGIGLDRIAVRQGDTDDVPGGRGTSGSRSIPLGVPAVRRASRSLAMTMRAAVAARFGAVADKVILEDGFARIVGTNHAISFADLAQTMEHEDRQATGSFQQPEPSYPNGTHICELEIDPETGVVQAQNLVVVDDFGVVINPMLLDGQIHGGVAQGLGQALLERTVYDSSGQLLTASLMDYCMPRAEDMPPLRVSTRNVPCKWNEMGIKGAGEAGAVGATPAIANAVVDALNRAYGITDFVLPATPQRVWQAIQEHRAKSQERSAPLCTEQSGGVRGAYVESRQEA